MIHIATANIDKELVISLIILRLDLKLIATVIALLIHKYVSK